MKLKAQLQCGDELAMGPGKADLLDAIAMTGSISAAGRHLGFSYRRTWMLVDTMNRCWREPLVQTVHGGKRGGGATLTPLGGRVLARYRYLQAAIAEAAAQPFEALIADMLAEPRAVQNN